MKVIHTASAALLGAAVILSACATTPPPPSAEMTRAKAAIEQAQRAGAREYATEYLNASMEKLDLAEAASAKGNNASATRLVEESYADAHLAQISAQSAKSAKAAADVDKSIQTLQHEANRANSQ
jgi:Domain of unknown function (DUF4398)